MTDLSACLETAKKAARAAGDILSARGSDVSGVLADAGRDIKLVADKAAEAVILKILDDESDLPVLSEETGWTAEEEATVWVVDPLDGSANYNREIPLCCVSIALVSNGEPVLGVIFDFNHGELYSGIVGEGAWKNDTPMSVTDVDDTRKGILFTGLPLNRDFSDEALSDFAKGLSKWKKVRMIGSAATSITQIACGKGDRYHENGIMIWDVAAGCALTRAAGGRVYISAGPLDAPKIVVADNGKLPPEPFEV